MERLRARCLAWLLCTSQSHVTTSLPTLYTRPRPILICLLARDSARLIPERDVLHQLIDRILIRS
jgi:hypothetical protein